MKLRIELAFVLTPILFAAACDGEDPGQGAVGNGPIDRDGRLQVSLRGETRLVAIEQLGDGGRGVTVQDEDELLLAAAYCDGDETVLVDIDPDSPGIGGACADDACELDDVTEEVLHAAANGELDDGHDSSFRRILAVQWCQSTCVLAYWSETQTNEAIGCIDACNGAFCPIGCF